MHRDSVNLILTVINKVFIFKRSCKFLDIDPVSIIPSQNLTSIRINDDITLICSTNGTPSVSYIWRFKQNVVSTSTTLILNKLANSEVGEYQCEASNGITKATKSLVLEIHCELVLLLSFLKSTE